MSAELSIEMETGVVFRNPMAHVTSRHAYFPSAIPLGNAEVLVSYNVGEAFEAEDLRVHLSRSLDGGRTWADEGRLGVPEVPAGVSEGTKMAVDSDGKIVGLLQRHDRRELAGEGLTHTGTLGFVPTRFGAIMSGDGGRTWGEPCRVEPPIEGPEWELCAPITELSDGRWLLISSTWPDWSGSLPNGHQLVAFVSNDRGASWPEWMSVMSEPGSEAVIFWETKIVELPDGRLLAVAWCHDLPAAEDRPNQYALSSDGGATWTPHRSTGLIGQTQTPLVIGDGRMLVVFRRTDEPGLWLQDVRIEGDEWVNAATRPLWGHGQAGSTRMGDSMAENFRALRFGAPSVVRLDDGAVFVVFWCYEDNVSVIRWIRLELNERS